MSPLENKKRKKEPTVPALKTSIAFQAFGQIKDGYVRMDFSGNVREMNDKAKEILGYDNAKETFNARNLIYKDDFAYTLKSFTELCKKGAFKNYNARAITKNGTIKKIHLDTRIIYNDQNKPIGAHGLLKEITDPKDVLGPKTTPPNAFNSNDDIMA